MRVVGKPHPNIYEFIEVIQREQAATEISMLQLDAGARPPRRGIRAIARDRKIKDRFAPKKFSLTEIIVIIIKITTDYCEQTLTVICSNLNNNNIISIIYNYNRLM